MTLNLLERKKTDRIPEWLYRKLAPAGWIDKVAVTISDHNLHTVCESALCPNRQECWSRGTATFMILGDICTRTCGFCAIRYANPMAPDPEEPENTARAVRAMKLRHVVITSVARDDLQDEGANHFVQTIKAVRRLNPKVTLEILTPDFSGRSDLLELVAGAKPDIFNHNLETCHRLTGDVRSKATYDRSLAVLRTMRVLLPDSLIKSGLMVGLGESEDEIFETMDDLRLLNCDILTLGQYIRPTKFHLPVVQYYPPDKFRYWKEIGMNKGFRQVVSGPLVRSSYHADEILTHIENKGRYTEDGC